MESRTKNASRNLAWGIFYKSVSLLLPFVSRTIILYLLGTQYLGVGTLFTSILSFLSLTELGLGSAIVFAMYRPIAENDVNAICSLFSYFRRMYCYIGSAMLVIGTLLMPAVPCLMNGGSPDTLNVYALYFIYLLNSVLSYFFAGYRVSLLLAYQREDVSTKLLGAVNFGVQVGQIIILCLTHNFYAYAIVPIVGTIVSNYLYYRVTRALFPEIRPVGQISKETRAELRKRISGLIGTKLNSIIVHSADTIVISAFIGLEMTAVYGNYYSILNVVCGFILVFYSAITAGIGNKLVVDSIDENFALFKNISFLNSWIVCIGTSCFLCLYEPFMSFWVGEELTLGVGFSGLMVLYFFVYQIQKTILTYKDAAGLWHADRYRPYVSMVINLVSNIILVNVMGIYGVVVSTVLAFLVSLPWANRVLFKYLFHMDPLINMKEIAKSFIITSIISFFCYIVCAGIAGGIRGILIRLVVCVLGSSILFAIFAFRSKELRFWLTFFKRYFYRKKGRTVQ